MNAFSRRASLSVATVLIFLGTSFAVGIIGQVWTQGSSKEGLSSDIEAALADARCLRRTTPKRC